MSNNKAKDKIKIKKMNDKRERFREQKFKYEKLVKLFNVHADLHIIEIIREYETAINYNVLLSELKHKYFIYLSFFIYLFFFIFVLIFLHLNKFSLISC